MKLLHSPKLLMNRRNYSRIKNVKYSRNVMTWDVFRCDSEEEKKT